MSKPSDRFRWVADNLSEYARIRAALHEAADEIDRLTAQSPAAEVTDEIAKRAEAVRVNSLQALVAYGSAGFSERHDIAMKCALESVWPYAPSPESYWFGEYDAERNRLLAEVESLRQALADSKQAALESVRTACPDLADADRLATALRDLSGVAEIAAMVNLFGIPENANGPLPTAIQVLAEYDTARARSR